MLGLIFVILLMLIVPQLISSILDFFANYKEFVDTALANVNDIISTVNNSFGTEISMLESKAIQEALDELIKNLDIEAFLGELITLSTLSSVWLLIENLFFIVTDTILGLFISLYILSSKEKRVAQFRKFRAAYMSDKQGGILTEFITLVDKTFGGFFKGVLVDALAVGVAMFIALSVFRVSEYNLLIATICAVTNVIPVFGPFIGAVPSGIIILLTNPEKLLLFIVIVLVIQQLDGNILVPLIQGNNTGISSLAVLVSITVMGGLFGIPGMVLGVPVFAVVIELCKRAIEEKLRGQKKETDTTFYYRKGAVGNAEEEVYYEHAHLRYKYEHSRIKPHVDKVLAAISRLWNKGEAPAADATAETAEAAVSDEMSEQDTDEE